MSNTKTTQRALVTSVLALFLCFAMLFGTTYAWFTSQVTTGTNTVKSANYQVSLQSCDTFDGTYTDLTNSSVLFNDVTLTPGEKTTVMYIKITNNNSYAVKASVSIGEVNTTGGTNEMKLAHATVTETKTFADGDFSSNLAAVTILNNVEIEAGQNKVVAIQIMLPTSATNPSVTNTFAITVGATQQSS